MHDFFAAQWTGTLKIRKGGSYHFMTISDDGSKMWVDDNMVSSWFCAACLQDPKNGTLADLVVDAMKDRFACLMANHGMLAGGMGIAQALWRAQELETLAKQYSIARTLKDPVILSEQDIQTTLEGFKDYGVKGK